MVAVAPGAGAGAGHADVAAHEDRGEGRAGADILRVADRLLIVRVDRSAAGNGDERIAQPAAIQPMGEDVRGDAANRKRNRERRRAGAGTGLGAVRQQRGEIHQGNRVGLGLRLPGRRPHQVLDFQHVGDRGEPALAVLFKGSDALGKCADEFAVDIEWTAAHAVDRAGQRGLWVDKAANDQVEAGALGVSRHADHLGFKRDNGISLQHGVGQPMHPGVELAHRHDLGRPGRRLGS